MPWLVFLFGLMIAPLGVVSIFFVIIQPIVIGTWATLTLVGAAAMLIQIPYSLDELLATIQFVRRRARSGRPRSEEHTSELQSLMRISYAVFCLKKKQTTLST